MALAETIRQLSESAPRLYSRWSPRAWRAACEGPALRLWEALGEEGGAAGFDDYLFLLREAVGLQYLTAHEGAEGDGGVARSSFLSAALCEAVPRLLPRTAPVARPHLLAMVWNAGEKLLSQPPWLDRYLAIRLGELASLEELPEFLARVVAEGLGDEREARWERPFRCTVLDPSRAVAAFLPGEMHLAGASLVCVHDRRAPGSHVAVLLRARERGGPLLLGATPCLGREAEPPRTAVPVAVRSAAFLATGLPDDRARIAVRSGHVLFTSELSQRLFTVEAAA